MPRRATRKPGIGLKIEAVARARATQRIAMSDRLFADQHALAALCLRHHISRLSLFGSTLSGTNRPDSDVDLLVEFEPGKKPGLLKLADIEAELSTLLGGRTVDLRSPQDLNQSFRDDVTRTAEVQFAAR